jgi:acylphosphatase
MKKGREIIISGSKVCGVGYRPFLLLTALSLGIEKVYAYNVLVEGTEKVIVHLQSDEGKLNSYANVIKSSTPEHARVDRIEETDYQGEVMDAGVYLQFLQFEQINKAVPAILSIDKKQSTMLEKQDSMLERQDETISILKEVKEDTSSIRNDISELKKDAKDSILEKYFELSREIAEIKATLSDIKAKVS